MTKITRLKIICIYRRAAEALSLADEIVTIEAGKIAVLVAFERDRTIDIDASSRVVAIFQEGLRMV